jgi:hypothetical protein
MKILTPKPLDQELLSQKWVSVIHWSYKFSFDLFLEKPNAISSMENLLFVCSRSSCSTKGSFDTTALLVIIDIEVTSSVFVIFAVAYFDSITID